MPDIYRIGVSLALTNRVSGVLGVIAKDFLGVRGEIGKTEAAMARLKGVMIGAAGVLAGGAILGGMVKLVEHGAKLVDQQIQLKNLGVSSLELAQATAQAWQNSADVLGTTVSRNLELIREAKGAFGTVADADALSGALSRADAVRTFVNHNQQDDRGLQAIMKAIEIRGDIRYGKDGKMDRGYAEAGLNSALKFLNASGGQIDASTIKGLITMAGPMAKMMNPDAFYRMMLTATEELQQKAGTSLSAAGRALYGGIMPQRNSNELERLGLINPAMVHVRRGGNVSIDQGALKGFDTLNGPGGLNDWVQKFFRPALHSDYLKQHKLHAGLSEQQYDQQELYRALPTETFRRLMGIFLQQAESVKKGATNYDQALGLGSFDNIAGKSLTASMTAFRAAWDNLLTSLGAPLVTTAAGFLRGMADGMNSMALFFSAHPDMVRVLGELTTAFGSFLVLGGSIKIMSIALGPFATGLRALVTLSPAMTSGAAALGSFAGSIGLVAAAVGAWALAWHLNKPAFDDMMGSLHVRADANAERDYLKDRSAKLPYNQRIAFNKNHPGIVNGEDKGVLEELRDWLASHVGGGPAKGGDLHAVINVPGQKPQKVTVPYSPVQSGTTGHDGSMGAYPAGLPAGGG